MDMDRFEPQFGGHASGMVAAEEQLPVEKGRRNLGGG